MNFSRSGWLEKYIDFRGKNPFPSVLPTEGVKVIEDASVHNDLEQAIYYFLQPTGLLYGGLVGLPFPEVEHPDSNYFDSLDRVYFIFLESLYACLVADRHFLLDNFVEEDDRFPPAVEVALPYFLGRPVAPHEPEPRRWFRLGSRGGERREYRLFEREIRQRLTHGSRLYYRPDFSFNGFLFLDLYHCLMWQRHSLVDPDNSIEILQTLKSQGEEQRVALLNLIICAAATDGVIYPMERRIIEHFLKSSRLSKATLAEFRRRLVEPIRLDEIVIPEMPWLIRRFFLDLTLMIFLADRSVSNQEREFLVQMVDRLDLWSEELAQSQSAMELFLISHEDRLPYFNVRSSIGSLRNRLQEKATLAVRKNLNRIVIEIKETGELYSLLIKATKTKLDPEEKRRVQAQLMDILKTIPALAIFALPGGGIILPVLIKLLPFNLLPSAFED